MTKPIWIPFIISSFFFSISFLLSWRVNVWGDALWRSTVVFLFTLCVGFVVVWLLKYAQRKTDQQEEVHQEDGQQDAEDAKADDKGQHIHLETPEDEFIPWEPEHMRGNENRR